MDLMNLFIKLTIVTYSVTKARVVVTETEKQANNTHINNKNKKQNKPLSSHNSID